MGALQNHDHDHGRRDIDMEKLCEICGDVGFSDAIRVCSVCNVTREHAYCIKVLHEAEVDTWICEDCKSCVAPQFQCVPRNLPHSAKTSFTSKKPPHNTKVKFISTGEAKALHSRTMMNESMLQSKSQLFRRSKDKPYVSSIRLTTMASTSRAKQNTQVEVPGFKGSNGKNRVICSHETASGENALPVCSRNVLTNKHSTFQDIFKHDTKKVNIHSVRTIEVVQCLSAVDQVASKMPKFCGHQSKFVQRRSYRSVVLPKEFEMDVIGKSCEERMDVEPNYKGEKRGAHILETIEGSESDSDDTTLFRRMIRNKMKVDEVKLKTGCSKASTRGNERRLKPNINEYEILASCCLHGKKRKVAEVDHDSKCAILEDEVKVNHSKESTQFKNELQENNLTEGLFLGDEVKEDDPKKSTIRVNKSSKNNSVCPFSTINFKEHHSEDPPLGDNSKKSTPREDVSPKNNSTTRPLSMCELKEHNFEDAPQVDNPKKSFLRGNMPPKNYSTTLPFSACDLKEHNFDDVPQGDYSNKSTLRENVSPKNNSTTHSFSACDLSGHNYADSTLRDVFEKSSPRENESLKNNYQESMLREDQFHENGSDASMFLANEWRDNNIENPNLRELALLEKNRKASLLLLAHELIYAIMCDEDSLLKNVSVALSRSLEDSIVTDTTPSIKAITMCHSLLNENVKLKKLVADGGKLMNELEEGIQGDRTLLKDGINKQLVSFDKISKQVSEKLASYEDRLSQAVSFVNEFQLMQKNQDALSAYELGKKVARRRLQSAISKMCPNIDWLLVEANF